MQQAKIEAEFETQSLIIQIESQSKKLQNIRFDFKTE